MTSVPLARRLPAGALRPVSTGSSSRLLLTPRPPALPLPPQCTVRRVWRRLRAAGGQRCGGRRAAHPAMRPGGGAFGPRAPLCRPRLHDGMLLGGLAKANGREANPAPIPPHACCPSCPPLTTAPHAAGRRARPPRRVAAGGRAGRRLQAGTGAGHRAVKPAVGVAMGQGGLTDPTLPRTLQASPPQAGALPTPVFHPTVPQTCTGN
jgi:hypothetical protein